ncbi:MAG TPA: replication initiation protein [Enterococcus aquimarinus]|nr:replication initiation protein [Enterococcus aquimarinus]
MAKKQNYIWRNDRNFALDEYEKQQYYYVVESNDIINKARHDLTARELKIMDFVISKIQPEDTQFNVIKTSMYELTKVLNIKQNGKNYGDMAKALGDLRKKEVLIYDDEHKTITQTGWVQSAKYHENGQVEIRLNEDLSPHLLGLKNHYTQHLLIDTVKLKSKYSILLYKLMRECDKDKGKSIAILQGTPEEFKEWLGAPKDYDFRRLKENVLKKAIEEINLKIDDMDLEILQAKHGRKVIQVEIHNNWTVQKAIKENSENAPRISMHNWLDDSLSI